jgi:glutamyl-tRNA reductase
MTKEVNHFSSKPRQITIAATNVSTQVFGEWSNIKVLTVNNTKIAETIFNDFKKLNPLKVTKISDSHDIFFEKLISDKTEKTLRSIKEFDIIIIGCNDRNKIINTKLIKKILKERKQKPLLIIDCGIPGNVDTKVRLINNCFLFDLNDLEQIYSEKNIGNNRGFNFIETDKELNLSLENFYRKLKFNSSQKLRFENKLRNFFESSDARIYNSLKIFFKYFK